jgi:tRNA U34 5-methylaminomethyl-2-thiouridine-forming methyltransferase MnmC
MPTAGYKLVQLRNGAQAVYSSDYDEKMHPGLGPADEAELLYVRQLKISERMRGSADAFVVWDVGLGAAANAIAMLRATREMARPLRLVSFDDTAGPLVFALENVEALGYLRGYEPAANAMLERGRARFVDGAHEVDWQFHLGDFPAWLAQALERRSPHAILFDAFSPAKNPAMWTLPVCTNLFRRLDPERPCSLTTYSRSTMIRVTLLLAGFFVGRGVATGLKEETTVAANSLTLLDDPLDRDWLERACRSGSAEPLHEPVYRQDRLSAASGEKLQAHRQFR